MNRAEREDCITSGGQVGETTCSNDIVRQNIELVEHLEKAEAQNRGPGEHLAEKVMRFCGSIGFIWFHVFWFSLWITLNVVPGFPHWDKFPFSFLTLTVSLEAIFLTIFILIAQN